MSIQIRRALAPVSFVLLLCVVAASSTRWAQDAAAVDLVIEEVNGSVSVLYGRGGNIAFSNGPDGMLLIDSQFDWLASKIEKALLERQADGPAFLINTHLHGDHTGGNATLGRNGVIVAHVNTRGRMIEERGGGSVSDELKPALPVITFEDELTLHFNGEEVRLIHLPNSHTDTDVVVWFSGSNVLHMGDLFFAGTFPFIDLGRGGSVDGLISSVQRLLELVPADTRIIPGHGAVCGVEQLGGYLEMLMEARARVSEAQAAGRSADEMCEVKLLGDLAEAWGGGFISADAFIETLASTPLDR